MRDRRPVYDRDSDVPVWALTEKREPFQHQIKIGHLLTRLDQEFPDGFRARDVTDFLKREYFPGEKIARVYVPNSTGSHRFLTDLLYANLINVDQERRKGSEVVYKIVPQENQ